MDAEADELLIPSRYEFLAGKLSPAKRFAAGSSSQLDSRRRLEWTTFMYALYSALLAFFLVLTLPYWLLQMLRHGKYRAGLRQRFGAVPPAWLVTAKNPPSGYMRFRWAKWWLRAQCRGAAPKIPLPSHTDFDYHQHRAETRRQSFGAQNVFYFPVDFAFAIRPYLDALRPELVVVAETEFWPNFLHLAKPSGARIAVINCRISDRSFPGYKRPRLWLPRLLEKSLANVDLFLAQTQEDQRRLIEIGADEGKVKSDRQFEIRCSASARRQPWWRVFARVSIAPQPGPILVCGSTLENEEGSLLLAFRNIMCESSQGSDDACARAILSAFSEVAALVEELGFRMSRRSLWSGEPLAGGVFLVDSIGELTALYSLATVAFVGGSLVPRGGHNILEPALYGVPIVTGNHYENFRDIVNFFASLNAVRIAGLAELPLVFMELIENA